MVTVTTLPRGRAFTRDDLRAMPDDGNRYELLDGILVVTPSPALRHQGMVGELYVLLRAACPPSHRVVLAPFDVALGERTVLQPDLIVAARSAFTDQQLPQAPELAVEVLSPSTRLYDRHLKKARLEAAGCAHYWVVDPDGPSITAWALSDAAYVEVAHATGSQTFRIDVPVAITVRPVDLLD